jgi:hypothetical protein
METINMKLTGVSPLLMHSDRFANPLDPLTKAHKELTGKKKKTDEDHEAIALSEWRGSLYFDKTLGPYIPGQNIEAVITCGAKLQKLGTKFKQGFMVKEDKVKLEYVGPRIVEALQNDVRFIDMRSVKVQQARLQRCRPIFAEWSLSFTILFNPEVIEKRDVLKAIDDAGMLIGLGDYRPRFGKFEAQEV